MLKLTSIAFAAVLMITGTAFAGGEGEYDKDKMMEGQQQETVIPQEGEDAVTGQTQETVVPGEEQEPQSDELQLDEEEPLIEEEAQESESY